jgi:hypothetical protein
MKIQSQIRYSVAAYSLAWLLGCCATPGFAQTTKPAPKETAPPKQAAPTRSESPYSLEIADGKFVRDEKKVDATLENVIDLLRDLAIQRTGEPPNIVLSPGLPRIQIGNLKLRANSLEQELEALRVASGYKFMWSTGDAGQGIDPTTGLPITQPRPADASSLYLLTEGPNAPDTKRQIEVFNLSGYFQSLGPPGDNKEREKLKEEHLERIMKIVTETVHVFNLGHATQVDRPDSQYYSGANLLVLIGEPEALEIAAKVIGALPGIHRAPDASRHGAGFGGGRAGAPPPAPGKSSEMTESQRMFYERYGVAPR